MEKKSIRIWILSGILGLAIFLRFYDFAFPEAAVDLHFGRKAAVTIADGFLVKNGFDPKGYEKVVAFDSCNTDYLQKTVGLDIANQLLKKTVPCWRWDVRYFKAGQREGFYVEVAPATGEVIYFNHKISEDDKGAKLSQDKALKIAERVLIAQGYKLNHYNLRKNSTTGLKNRTDHFFTWINKDFAVGDSELHVSVSIAGKDVQSFSHYLKTPDEFYRQQKRDATSGMVLYFLSGIGMIGLCIALIVCLIVQNKLGRIRWRFALAFALIPIPMCILALFNDWPTFWFRYPADVMSKNLYFGINMVQAVLGVLLIGLLLFVMVAAGEAMAKVINKDAFPIIDGFRRRTLTLPQLELRLAAGYGLGFFGLGYVTVFYLIATSYFSVWQPISPDYTELLATRMPFLYPLTTALIAAMSEEFFFRLFGISLLRKFSSSAFLPVMLTAFIWASGHATYAVYPMYIRVIELTIVGAIWGYVFWKYGIETVIMAHYVYNSVLMGLPLLRSNNVYFVVSGVIVIFLLLLPGILLAFWVKRRAAFSAPAA